MHIYRHKANGGDMSLPVTYLLKNATKFIYVNTSFFKVFFTIKELPYIAVLDENNYFYGILTHSTLLNILAQSWNVKQRELRFNNCFSWSTRRLSSHFKNHLPNIAASPAVLHWMSIVKNLFVAHLLLYQPAQLPKRVQPL